MLCRFASNSLNSSSARFVASHCVSGGGITVLVEKCRPSTVRAIPLSKEFTLQKYTVQLYVKFRPFFLPEREVWFVHPGLLLLGVQIHGSLELLI